MNGLEPLDDEPRWSRWLPSRPGTWTALALALSLLGCGVLAVLHWEQHRLIDRTYAAVNEVRQARLDFAHGFLHVSLAGRGPGPFDRGQGLALLEQAQRATVRGIEEVLRQDLLSEPARRRLEQFPARMAAFREVLRATGAPDDATRQQVAYHAVLELIELADVASRYELRQLNGRLDRRFRWSLGMAALLIVGVCGGVYSVAALRRKTLAALRANERRLILFVENAPAALAMLDRRMCYIVASRRWREDYELGEQPLRGRSHYEVFPEIREDWRRVHQRALAGKVVRSDGDRFERSDGTVQWLRWEVSPWQTDDGEVGGVVIFSEDVSLRRLAEETRTRLAAIVESSDDAIVGHDLDGVITSWNRGAERMFGHAAAEVVGQPMTALLGRESAEAEAAILGRIRRGEGVGHFETERMRKDGQRIEVSVAVSPIRTPDGAVVGASRVVRDITERNRNLRALRASEARLEAVVENLAEGLVLAERDGRIVHWNRAALALHGLDAQPSGVHVHLPELQSVFELREATGRALAFDEWPMARLLRGERVEAEEFALWRRGTAWHRTLSYNGTVVREVEGRELLLLSIRDVTARQAAEEARERQSRRVALLGEISRQLVLNDEPRSLLSAIFRDLTKVLNLEVFVIYLVSPGRSGLSLESVGGVTAEQREVLREARCGEILCSLVARDERPLILAELGESTLPEARTMVALGVRAYAGHPLKAAGRLIGTIAFGAKDRRCFSEEDVHLMKTVADQVAAAMERHRLMAEIQSGHHRFRTLVDQAVDGIFLHTLEGRIVDVNQRACESLGYSRAELLALTVADLDDIGANATAREAWSAASPAQARTVIGRHRRKDGSHFPVEVRLGRLELEGQTLVLALARDISERVRAERLLVGQAQVMEMIARQAPLDETLNRLVEVVEAQADELACSILLLDAAGRRLHHGAAPSLPPSYVAEIDGIEIGPLAGSCGTAAFFGEPVVVEDIATDARWARFREVARRAELAACWSTPLLDSQRRVLGTVAFYRRTPGRPTPTHLRLSDVAAHTAAICITRARAVAELRDSEARYRLLAENMEDVIWQLDVETMRFTYVSPSVQRLRGYTVAEVKAQTLEETMGPESAGWIRETLPRRIVAFKAGDPDAVSRLAEVEQRRKDGSTVWTEALTTLVRDVDGRISLQGTSRDCTRRRTLERELQHREMLLREAGELAHVGAWEFDPATGEGYWSAETARIHDLAEDVPINAARGIGFYVGESRERIAAAVAAAVAHGTPYDLELEMTTATGRKKWVRTIAHPLMEHGRVIKVRGSLQDMTQRKQVEELLRTETERFTKVAAISPSVVHSFREAADGAISLPYASPGIAAIYGLTPAELARDAAGLWRCWHPDDVPALLAGMQTSRRQLTPWLAEFRVRHPAKGEIWVESRSMPVADADGSVTWHGTLTDITDRKREARRAATRAAVSLVLADVYSLDEAGPRIVAAIAESEGWDFGAVWERPEGTDRLRSRAQWARPGLEGVAQLSEQTLRCSFGLGEGLPGLVWERKAPVRMDDVAGDSRYVRGGAAGRAGLRGAMGFPILRRDEVIGVVDFLARELKEPDEAQLELLALLGRQIGLYLERRRAEAEVRRLNAELEQRVLARTAELQAANRELEAFTYSVSHDLRAPLRAVDGFALALAEDHGALLPPEGRRFVQLVREGAQRMGRLIDDLLALSRLGRQPLAFQPVAMRRLVDGVWADLLPERTARTVEWVVGDLPDAQADPALLRQVWLNLLGNALKYTRRRAIARIEVTGDVRGDAVYYTIKDNGAGFDMRYAHKLFGVFQRLHRAEDYDGTGVGLAIVQRLVQRHHGQIQAEGAVDVGATFVFSLRQSPPSAL